MSLDFNKLKTVLEKHFTVKLLQLKRNENAIFLLNNKMILKAGDIEVQEEYHTHISIYRQLSSKSKKLIAKPYDLGKTFSQKFPNLYFYCMEYINGMSLKSFLNQQLCKIEKTLPQIKKDLRHVFTEMWKLGYLHGDLHLDNIIVTPNNKIKVIDFGFALKVSNPLKNNENVREWFNPTWQKFLKKQHIRKGNPNIWVAGGSPDMFASHHKNLLYKGKFI